MNQFKTPLQWLLIIATITLGYFSVTRDIGGTIITFFCIFSLALVYHTVVDGASSKLFLAVISLFVLAEVFSGLAFFKMVPGTSTIFLSYLSSTVGCILIFRKVVLETKFKFSLNRRSWIIFVMLAINGFVIYLILDMMSQFNMSWRHLFLGFGQTMLKLLLLSLGLASYAVAAKKSSGLTLLYWTIGCFFLGEAINIVNYSLYTNDLVLAYILLTNGLLVIGVFAFYLYCTRMRNETEFFQSKNALEV